VFLVTKVKEITEARASVGLLLATAVNSVCTAEIVSIRVTTQINLICPISDKFVQLKH